MLGHMVVLSVIFSETSILFSTVAASIYIPTNSVQGFPFFHILTNICCVHFFLIFFFLIFIYLWLCRVSISAQGLSPAAASGGHSSSQCTGLSPSWPLPLRSTGSRRTGGMWDLPRPGPEPASPAPAGRLPTTAPPGKPCCVLFDGSHPDSCEVMSHCGFDLHFPDD